MSVFEMPATGGESYAGESYAGESYSAESHGSESYGSESYSPESYGSESYAGESYAGEASYGAESYGESYTGWGEGEGRARVAVRRPDADPGPVGCQPARRAGGHRRLAVPGRVHPRVGGRVGSARGR